MSDKKLESFKVGAKQPTGMRKAGKATPAAPAAAPAPTLGFARIESILDKELASDVQQSLGGIADELDAIANSSAAAKEKANAKRGKVAVVRTVELLAYLFETKQQLLDAYVAGQKNDPKQSKQIPAQTQKKGGR